MEKNIVFILLSLCYSTIYAQDKETKVPPIVFKGNIIFERKSNTHKQLEEMMKSNGGGSSFLEMMKKKLPKYKIDIFELTFTDKTSLYRPAKDGITETNMMMGNLPAERNIVFNDYESAKTVAEKKVFDKTFLIKDSLKKIDWKITEDFRKIAGYNCRRAETIIMDSIYVIAFYSDAMLASGGPEGFNGLPGMILGVVIPRLNVTYFATKVDNFIADEKVLVAPTKGEKSTHSKTTETVKESTKQWGAMANRFLWYIDL
jgi:GLPGLI family protein